MGCAASKLDNEDTVRRCKERRRLMKDAVFARHHLAAAHADYCRSLRHTGSSLAAFAAGEHLAVSEQTPPVLLQPNQTPLKPIATAAAKKPPPPPPSFSPSPTIASSKLPHIISSSSVKSAAAAPPKQRNIRTGRPKLPHILSESSSPTGSLKSGAGYGYPTEFRAESTYSSTPSQASSVWNWENFYPPSPPGSDFFDRKAQAEAQSRAHHLEPDSDDEDRSETDVEIETRTKRSGYDFFRPEPDRRSGYSSFSNNNNTGSGGAHKSKKMAAEEETEREEVQCSEWGDRYSTTSSSSSDVDDRAEEPKPRSEAAAAARSVSSTSSFKQAPSEYPRKPLEEEEDAYSMRSREISPEMRMVVRHRDLKEIVDAIRKNFDDAASAGDQVSDMLEVGRAQLDRSFSQLKKTVYHSSSILSNLSSSWTSKPPLAVKYRLDTEPASGPSSLCSTLDRLLAWEKKLYEDVKAREGVKIEHEKKLSTMQSQEYKGEDEAKLDKTKASIKRLQSLIIVTSQAVSTTSTAIVGLRDSDLVPQLVELCHGFMYMWRSMHQYHEVQNNIVQQVRGLVKESTMGDSTSELHRQATRDLESAVSAWHSSFCLLIKFQRDFVRSVQAWFKLTLLPVSNDNPSGKAESSDAYNFFDEWKLALDRVPDTVASEAIKSFINVVHVISAKQSEELKIKKITETVTKELEKKSSSLRKIERKFYQSYSMVGIGLPESGPDNGHVLDARDPLSEKKSELAACQRRVEDELLRHAKAVEVTRAMTLNNLQTGLPGVFQALTNFSSLFTEALGLVCTHSYAIK